MAGQWRYLAQRLDGSGQPGAWLHTELPLTGVQITDVLSGPPQLTGTLTPRYRSLIAADGQPLLSEWGTAIYAEQDGQIRGGGIYLNGAFTGPSWAVDVSGFSGYPKGMPWELDSVLGVIDPLEVVRYVWNYLQSQPGGDLGMVLDPTSSDRRVGKPATRTLVPPTAAEVAAAEAEIARKYPLGYAVAEDGTRIEDPGTYFGMRATPQIKTTKAEPYLLNWWTHDDLGSIIDGLARDTPFDYHEQHRWNADRTAVEHRLRLGYPALGRRREDLRFVLGENVHTTPTIRRDGESYASQVVVLGAGEGRDMVRGTASARGSRIRRVVTLDAKDVTDTDTAATRARQALAMREVFDGVTDLTVTDTPSTPLGSWTVGDELRVQAETDWVDIDTWVRVVSITVRPEDPESIAMSVVRSGQ